MSEELKPCPFCGGPAELDTQHPYRSFSSGQWRNEVAIYCVGDGGCPTHMGICYEDVKDATTDQLVDELIAKWNNRHTPEGYAMVPVESLQRAAEWFTESQGWNWLEYEDKPLDIDEMLQCVDELKKFKAMIAAATETNVACDLCKGSGKKVVGPDQDGRKYKVDCDCAKP